MYTTDKLGNVRTHLSLRKLKPNNKEKNYAIYGTVLFVIDVCPCYFSFDLKNLLAYLCDVDID